MFPQQVQNLKYIEDGAEQNQTKDRYNFDINRANGNVVSI